MEKENTRLREKIKLLKEQQEKLNNDIAKLERDKILADGKIQQLEETNRDLRERYSELRQDMRELQGSTKRLEKDR